MKVSTRAFARNLKHLLHEKGVSKQRFIADLKISGPMFSHYINGINFPRWPVLFKMCKYFNYYDVITFLCGNVTRKTEVAIPNLFVPNKQIIAENLNTLARWNGYASTDDIMLKTTGASERTIRNFYSGTTFPRWKYMIALCGLYKIDDLHKFATKKI